jgi:hypothetical protein
MDNAEGMHSFHVRVSDDVIIRRCNTLVIEAHDSLAAIAIARRRAVRAISTCAITVMRPTRRSAFRSSNRRRSRVMR